LAGIILVNNNPLDVVKIMALSHASYGKMIKFLIWATGYNIVALPLGCWRHGAPSCRRSSGPCAWRSVPSWWPSMPNCCAGNSWRRNLRPNKAEYAAGKVQANLPGSKKHPLAGWAR